ncbi:nuclear transport factor 2 family protein [Falsihalocynthiibacter arcticus]|uniref:Lumazine-binding protein n=1 Tax=Falsihalocynthiibacter arcticus TaxID=1579316 RepID=A0A126V3C1_9RHOB|nr:nuclear transport factor 2 family protein [Falsihalocynthiibacter arcticus]AML52808.1 hypothetical protein RC74_17475 [Falsihalocynthiibacter arcticus]
MKWIEKSMHPLCMQAGHYNGQYEFFDCAEFIKSLEVKVMKPPRIPYDAEIISIDMTGDIAVVKVEDDCFGTTFTDYFSLIKSEGRWQIVMKIFLGHANA